MELKKPIDLEPDPKAFILLKSIETETEPFLKFRIGTEEFWNGTSTTFDSSANTDINNYSLITSQKFVSVFPVFYDDFNENSSYFPTYVGPQSLNFPFYS